MKVTFFKTPFFFHWTTVLQVLFFTIFFSAIFTLIFPYNYVINTLGASFIAIGLLFSVILHELAHLITAQKFKVPPLYGIFHGLGGVVFFDNEKKIPKKEFAIIAAAGPLVNIAFWLLIKIICFSIDNYFVLFPSSVWFFLLKFSILLGILGDMNLLLAAFNLIPAAPLDGAKILSAFLPQKAGIIVPKIISLLFVIFFITFNSYVLYMYLTNGISLLYLVNKNFPILSAIFNWFQFIFNTIIALFIGYLGWRE